MVRMGSRPDTLLLRLERKALMSHSHAWCVPATETRAGSAMVNNTDPAPVFVESWILARRPDTKHVITGVVSVCKDKYKVLQECYEEDLTSPDV